MHTSCNKQWIHLVTSRYVHVYVYIPPCMYQVWKYTNLYICLRLVSSREHNQRITLYIICVFYYVTSHAPDYIEFVRRRTVICGVCFGVDYRKITRGTPSRKKILLLQTTYHNGYSSDVLVGDVGQNCWVQELRSQWAFHKSISNTLNTGNP